MRKLAALAPLVLLTLVIFASIPTANGHYPGVWLTGLTGAKPSIDGVISTNEWAAAAKYNFSSTTPGSPWFSNGTFYVENDASNLYLALKIRDGSLAGRAVFIYFDNNHDGTIEMGESIWVYAQNGTQNMDAYQYANGGYSDTGAIQDGKTAATANGVFDYFEFSHPLCSGNQYDFCLKAGQTVGFDVSFGNSSGGSDWPQSLVGGNWADASQYGDIVIAPAAQGPPIFQFAGSACTEYQGNPLLNHSAAYGGVSYPQNYATVYNAPSVIWDVDHYKMWFSGSVNNVTGIFYGTSVDGLNWDVRQTPVVKPGTTGSWDAGTVYSPDVLKVGGTFFMYFTGNNGTSSYSRSIGVATSSDGLNWSEYVGNPVLTRDNSSYDSGWVRYGSVLYEGGTFKMWYTSHTDPTITFQIAVSYATSPDGFHWTKYAGNPVYGGATNFVEMPSVVNDRGTYLMAYQGSGGGIGFAYSFDGITWNNATYPFLPSPASSAWDSAGDSYPSLLGQGTYLLLWFHGTSATNDGIGLAYCHSPLIQGPTTTESTTLVSYSTLSQTSTATRTITSTGTVTTTSIEQAQATPIYFYVASASSVIAVALAILLARRRVGT